MEENELEEIVFTFFILGDSKVGKTSIIFKYLNDDEAKVKPSIGLELFEKELSKNENSKTIFKIWDCSGQERFRDVAASYCNRIDGAFIVYDITNRKSFESIDELANLFRKNNSQTSPIVLIGNKTDLKNERAISYDEGKKKADDLKAQFYEVSIEQNREIILEAFNKMKDLVLEKRENDEKSKKEKEAKKKGCCECWK